MLEQRPTAVAPVVLLAGVACALCATCLPVPPGHSLLLGALGCVGALLAAGPAWRWWTRVESRLR